MSKSNIISGIEVGSSKIATLVAQVQNDETGIQDINVVGVSSVESRGIKKGQIVDIEEAVEAIVESVEAAERMAGYNLAESYISIGGASIASQNSHGVVAVSNPNDEIVSDDVDRVIEAASAISLPTSRELIHVLPREFLVDGDIGVKDPIGMSGIRLEVETHLITASSASIKNLKKAVNEVGINPIELVYSGLAASYAVLTKTEKELGCILIDIGGGTTSIAIYIDGAIAYSAVLPVGAKNVSNDIAIGLQVSLETAEKIKLSLSDAEKKLKKKVDEEDQLDLSSVSLSDSKKVSKKILIDGIIKPRLNEIFSMVKIQLEKEGLMKNVPSGAILTGGGAETVNIEEIAKRSLGLPVRIGTPRGLGGLVDDVINPDFATVAGLIIYGASKNVNQPLTYFSKKIKLPSTTIFNKLLGTIKDLLP